MGEAGRPREGESTAPLVVRIVYAHIDWIMFGVNVVAMEYWFSYVYEEKVVIGWLSMHESETPLLTGVVSFLLFAFSEYRAVELGTMCLHHNFSLLYQL